MEFAQAAGALGLRAIHGAEIDLDDGRHLTLLVEDAHGLAQPVPAPHARARAHARARHEPPPQVPLETVEEHAEGLVCLSGCARQGVRDEPTMRRLLAAFGPDRLRVELQRPFQRHDRALNRGLASLAARLGVAVRGHRQRPRARALARARCRTRSWRCASTRRWTPPSPCGAATTRTCSPRRRRWPRASRTTRRRSRRPLALAERLRFDLGARPRLPLPGRRGRGRRPQAGRAVPVEDGRALPGRPPAATPRRTRAWTRSCG